MSLLLGLLEAGREGLPESDLERGFEGDRLGDAVSLGGGGEAVENVAADKAVDATEAGVSQAGDVADLGGRGPSLSHGNILSVLRPIAQDSGGWRGYLLGRFYLAG